MRLAYEYLFPKCYIFYSFYFYRANAFFIHLSESEKIALKNLMDCQIQE